jgi:hypothetical protein
MPHGGWSPNGKKNSDMDMNKSLKGLQDRFSKIKNELRTLLDDYDGMFREVNKVYIDEKTASGTTAGLEEFYRLIQVMRRNRDVIGSLVRGSNGLRPIDKFKFVEENVPEIKKKKNPLKEKKSFANPEIMEFSDIERVQEHI